jgi:hypothetical protein
MLSVPGELLYGDILEAGDSVEPGLPEAPGNLVLQLCVLPASQHRLVSMSFNKQAAVTRVKPQGADLLPLPLLVAKTSRNHLNEAIIPLLPAEIGE